MSSPIEKIITTLGDLLAAEANRLVARRKSSAAWLTLLEPVLKRNVERVGESVRFNRHDSVPYVARPPKVGPAADAADELSGGEGEPLAPQTRDLLRPLVGPEAGGARVHVDKRADALARSQSADAVTMGKDIFFRTGAFSPQTPSGLGLIAHELTHVAEAQKPGASWRCTAQEDLQEEERMARRRERLISQTPISPLAAEALSSQGPVQPAPPLATPRALAPAMSQPASIRPMRAATDRPQSDPLPAQPHPGPSPDALRRNMLRDLMSQVRIDYERGA